MKWLSPIGRLYGVAADARNALFDRGVREPQSLGAAAISVGNITAGGTGKTPLVRLICERLARRGEKVCVLTRGYGRKNEDLRVVVSDGVRLLADNASAGDEPLELGRMLLGRGVIVIADADRVAAAGWALENFAITAFVLDDGFQHRRARRDLDIVCIDATNPFGGRRVLPAGTLREPLKNLKRADAFVVTRSGLTDSVSEVADELRRYNERAAIFFASDKIDAVVPLANFLPPHASSPLIENIASSVAALPVFAFCGLGNPQAFFSMLERAGIDLAGRMSFGDHHRYAASDVERINGAAAKSNAELLLTTAKDAVKLGDFDFRLPCLVVVAKTAIDDDAEFESLLRRAVSQN